MAIEIEEIKQQAEEQAAKVQTTIEEDGWSKAFDDVIHADMSGLSTLIVVILAIILIKPILFLLRYVLIGAVIFMIVKYFLFYNVAVA
jgi:hypothetical protein